MKIAVACDDHGKVAEHFGRSACFEVFEFREGRMVSRESRSNPHVEEGGPHSHGDGQGHHGGLLNLLGDCQAMLCGGMGGRAAQDLGRAGVKPMVVSGFSEPEKAAEAYAAGSIKGSGPFHKCCHE